MKQLSRSVIFINTNILSKRIGLLEAMNDDDEDIFQRSILDRYIHRPPELEQMSYAEFGANYTVVRCNENEEDNLPSIHDHAITSRKIKLTDNFGTMQNVLVSVSISQTRIRILKTKLMLYLPWRDENLDILNGYCDYYWSLEKHILSKYIYITAKCVHDKHCNNNYLFHVFFIKINLSSLLCISERR